MEARQLWNYVRPTTTSSGMPDCTAFKLPSDGVLTLALDNIITLTADAVFQPECTGSNDIIISGMGSPTTYTDFRDPFYASTLPECYVLAATTVIAYMLVIMLLITPRTFLHQGAVILGRRGFTNGPSGSDAGIGIGGRPWLQKVAAATVAISLTIATADTFSVAQAQYERGYMDAAALQKEVEEGDELKVIRVISDTFLWLAQAQTLIRLFPRQREKIIIKWTAFALISLDVLFSILNNWVYSGRNRPQSFVDAVPALSYLFQLALSLLYCAWVMYYGITKKRFAFYHQQMRNICLVALLSLVSVLVPVVFFVVDISKPDVAGWGDYVRWVGAAAASVVVWEWVERIEALERNDKKDGVLGREVFDGDEMIAADPSSDSSWIDRFKGRRDGKDDDKSSGGGTATGTNSKSWPTVAGITNRYRPRAPKDIESGITVPDGAAQRGGKRTTRPRPALWPTRPPVAATPVSRTDTASPESTVYAIRYHPISEATPPVRDNGRAAAISRGNSLEVADAQAEIAPANDDALPDKPVIIEQMHEAPSQPRKTQSSNAWDILSNINPFKRRVQAPPLEVSAQMVRPQESSNYHGTSHRWDVRARLEDFAVAQADKFRERSRKNESADTLPKTVIPAPARRRDLAAALEELETAERGEQPLNSPGWDSSPHTTLTIPAPNEAESSHKSATQRQSDPYRPDDLNSHSIHQRGTLSFVTTAPQEREHEATEAFPPLEDARDRSFHSSPIQVRIPTSPMSPIFPRGDGLRVLSIPAPPRRRRSPEDDC